MMNIVSRRRFARGAFSFAALTALLSLQVAAYAAPAHEFLNGKLAWRSIGPSIGGRVVTVTGVPGVRNLFYMGAVDGGVWKSTNYGGTWHNITAGKWSSASGSVGAIAVAPSNIKTLYVGTGESDIRGDMVTGDGVFKSTDAGKTWHYAGLRNTRTISAIVVDPHNPDIVYAASMGHVFKPNADRGVFRSTDGGKTWHKILFVNGKTGAIDLVMDPRNPQVLYAAMWQAQRKPWTLIDGGPGSGLYKSTDGGAHWTNISRHPGLPQGLLGRIGVSVAASNPKVVYAIVQAKGGGVFRSDNGGATWKRVNDKWSLRQRGFYYTSIYVDPSNPDTVYVPNVDGVWVSHDGGKAFALLNMPHGDNHIVWISPADSKLLLVGNDGGATVSTDDGKTWSTEHNQPTGQFYHVAIDKAFPFNVYGAQQDEGSFEGPSAVPGGPVPTRVWHQVALGESTFVAPDPGHPDVTYGSDYFTLMQRYNWVTGARRSVSPEPEYRDGGSAAQMKYRLGWTHPIFFSPDNPKKLFLASQYVMTSEDGGRTWKTISPDLTRNDPATEGPTGGPVDLDQTGAEVFPDISALAVSTVDSHVIWAGSQDGLVHVTTDGGRHWRLVTPPQLKEWATISSIEPSHVSAGTAYLAASRYMWDDYRPYVFKTVDYGKHWTVLNRGLPRDEPAFVVRQDPQDASLLFLGTIDTVYASFDGGAHWRLLGLNLPHVEVRDLAIDTREGEIVAATHGRSFWILDNLSLLEQISHGALPGKNSAYLYAPQNTWLTSDYPLSQATVFFHIPQRYDGKTPVSLEFQDAQGNVVQRFTLHLKKKHKKLPATVRDNLQPSQAKKIAEQKQTAISPGTNRFHWNLRYADATSVIGFEPPEPADGMSGWVSGPRVNPGAYTAVLTYGKHSYKQTFRVKLDPRLHTTPAALKQHLALQLSLHRTLDALDQKINAAITARTELRKAVDTHKVSETAAVPVLKALDKAIHDVVQLHVRSSEGDVLHNMRLRSFIAYLQTSIGLDYGMPDPAQVAAYHRLQGEAQQAEATLRAATKAATRVF